MLLTRINLCCICLYIYVGIVQNLLRGENRIGRVDLIRFVKWEQGVNLMNRARGSILGLESG